MREYLLSMLGLSLSLWPKTPGVDSPGGPTDVILRSGDTSSGILKAGSTDYIKKAG